MHITRSMFLAVYSAVLMLAAAHIACGDEPWDGEPFSAEPAAVLKAIEQLPAPKDADIESLLEETIFRFDEQGRQEFRHRHVYRVLTETGVNNWSTTGKGWSPWHEMRPELQARVITRDGMVHKLDPSHITEAPYDQERDLLNDRRRLAAPLPAIEVGAVVEILATTKESRPFFPAGSFRNFAMSRFQPVRKSRVVIDAPEGMEMKHVVRGMDDTSTMRVQDGRRLIELKLEPCPMYQDGVEPYMPADMPRSPQIAFCTGRSWRDIAQAYGKLVEERLGEAQFADLARRLASEGQSPQDPARKEQSGKEQSGKEQSGKEQSGKEQSDKDRIARIGRVLFGLQEIVRYTGLEFGEATIVPAKPADTLVRRFGDCKDQSSLLVSLLRSIGFQAYVALINTDGINVEPDLPGIGQFNHAIVYVDGEQPLWIDPTVRWLRAGELPSQDQGKWALVIRPESEKLVRTPMPTSRDHGFREHREYILSDLGKGRVIETCEYFGNPELAFREHVALDGGKNWRQYLKSYLDAAYLSKTATRHEFTDPRKVQERFKLSLEVSDCGRAVCSPTAGTVVILPGGIFEHLPYLFRPVNTTEGAPNDPAGQGNDDENDATDKPRKFPFQFPMLHRCELICRIVAPSGFTVRQLPDNVVRTIGPATLSFEYVREGEQTVVATYRFDTGNGLLSTDEFNALKQELAKLNPNGSLDTWYVPFSLVHVGWEHEQAGRRKEAFANYRKWTQQEPQHHLHHVRLSEAYVNAGLVEAGQLSAQRAVEVAPQAATAHQSLGFASSFDAIGRDGPSGERLETALKAYRKAVELAPDVPEPHAALANLLEYDKYGHQYESATMAEAIQQYQLIQTKLKFNNWNVNLMLAQLYSGDFPGLQKTAEAAAPDVTRNSLLLAAIAVNEGVPMAVARSKSLAADETVRRQILLSGGDLLNFSRRYSLASEMLQAAIAENLPGTETLGSLQKSLARAKRWDEFEIPATDPRHVVQKVLGNVLADDERFGEYAKLFQPPVTTRPHRVLVLQIAVERLTDRLRELRRTPSRKADMAQEAKLTAEGDDNRGYRVRLSFEAARNMAWYVVKSGEEYRIIDVDLDDDRFSVEALRRLELGDVAGACHWLNWAWQEYSPSLRLFDSYSGSPFLRLWKITETAPEEEIRIAAAALQMKSERSAAAAIPVLVAAFEKADGDRRLQMDRALAAGYLASRQLAQAVECANRMLMQSPKAEEPMMIKVFCLQQLKQFDELEKLAKERLERLPKDNLARIWHSEIAESRGDVAAADKISRELVANPDAPPTAWNNLAWHQLFQDKVPEQALKDALKGAEETGFLDDAILHTLAAVCADLDKPEEARKYLLQAINARHNREIEPVDMYVLGRIAESYGLPDVAKHYYSKVTDNEGDDMDFSTSRLAQMRIKRLAKTAN